MKKIIVFSLFFTALSFFTVSSHARDTKLLLPIETAMNMPEAKEKLGTDVKFYFGNQKTPKTLKSLGSDFSNKKTNAFGKSDEDACNWAFLSAMISLKEHANKVGADSVVNIVSYYKKVEYSSTSQFECHAGAVMAGVALKGDFVKTTGN